MSDETTEKATKRDWLATALLTFAFVSFWWGYFQDDTERMLTGIFFLGMSIFVDRARS